MAVFLPSVAQTRRFSAATSNTMISHRRLPFGYYLYPVSIILSEQDVVCRSQPLSGITINGKAVALSTTNALSAIDTGTTLIGGPHDDVVSFYNAIPGSIALGSRQPGFYAYRM